MEEVSRVFVKGLPPSFAEDDFRKHFANRYNVTDVKLFPHRRIGYVGFKTPQDAHAAVKYFNKSFIRMSRISVELADNNIIRPQIAHPTSLKGTSSLATTPIQQDVQSNTLKRKRNDTQKDVKDSKLDEFLGLMRPPSKLKTWQDGILPGKAQVENQDNNPNLRDETKDSALVDEMRPRGAQPKSVKSTEPTESSVSASQSDNPTRKSTIQKLQESNGSVDSNIQQDEQVVEDHTEQGPTSDMDWMRSRTSRLLGLVEDDDIGHTSEPRVDSTPPEVPVVRGELPDVTLPLDTVSINEGSAQVEESDRGPIAAIQKSGRLYLRNLAYTISENELREHFSPWNTLQEIHLPIDPRTGQPKGFAFVQFEDHDQAAEAFEKLDGTVFQGRLLHIVPGAAKRETKIDDFALSKLPLKKQRQIQRKADATTSTFNWNSMYMNADAVFSSTAARLGVSKSELLDPTASDAAVKQAQAETHVIQETKAYFEANGIDLNTFTSRDRGDNPILVKNFAYGTKADDLRKLFSEHGDITRILMPPAATIAIVEFKQAVQAKTAFKALAYKKFNDTMLFLEKAPKALFKGQTRDQIEAQSAVTGQAPKPSTSDLMEKSVDDEVVNVSTLYVSNISFNTSSERFREWAQPLNGFVSAKIRMKPDSKNAGKMLSMGSGFLEFRTADQAKAALAATNGTNLDGHNLAIKPAKSAYDVGEERRKDDAAKRDSQRKSKLIIKNLPFEVSKKDITSLFKPYGAQRVRVPKKFDSTRKGFAFVEFATPREAESAKNSMRDTHLLGRRLVMEYAAGDAEDPEKEIQKMQQKIGRQANSVAAQRLMASSERKKFNIGGDEEMEGS